MNRIKEKIDIRYLILFVLAVIIFLPYVSLKFSYGHDYLPHISNITAIDEYLNISEGRIIPSKIRPIMVNGLGYGNGIFYPPLAYNITIMIFLVIKQLGLSIIIATKIFEFLVVCLSGMIMYKFVAEAFGNKDTALISAMFYMTSPYFLCDVFIRMAYGEMLVFLFIPMVMLGINYLMKNQHKKFIIFFALGYIGLIWSHLVVAVFFTMLLIIFLLVHIKEMFTKKNIFSFLVSSIIVLLVSSSFWGPMIEHKVKGDYVVFKEGSMAKVSKLEDNKLELCNFIFKNNDKKVIVYHNIIEIILFIVAIVSCKKIIKDDEKGKKFIGVFLITFISILISSKFIDWNKMPKIFYFIQFPWRMCTFISFGVSIIAALGTENFSKFNFKIIFIIVLIGCFLGVATINSRMNLIDSIEIVKEDISEVDSFAPGAQQEYLPVKAKKDKKYLQNRNQEILNIDGNTETSILKNSVPDLEFEIKLDGDEALVELPRIYYLGYTITLTNEKGNEKKLEYSESEKGLIQLKIKESGKVNVKYTGTNLNRVLNVVSVISGIGFLVFIVVEIIKSLKQKKLLAIE